MDLFFSFLVCGNVLATCYLWQTMKRGPKRKFLTGLLRGKPIEPKPTRNLSFPISSAGVMATAPRGLCRTLQIASPIEFNSLQTVTRHTLKQLKARSAPIENRHGLVGCYRAHGRRGAKTRSAGPL
jgi:hypothetical protein